MRFLAAALICALACAADSFLEGPPLRFEQLREALGAIWEGRLRQAVRSRGLAFRVTEQSLRELKHAGASEALLEDVRSARAPAPATAGPLEIECRPAECEVAVAGVPRGRTADGRLTLENLPPGDTVVELARDGHAGRKLEIALREGERAYASVELAPDADNEAHFALRLLGGAAAATGGASALALTGRLYVIEATGRSTEWPFRILLESKGTCTPVEPDPAIELHLGLFCRFQPGDALRRAAEGNAPPSAEGPFVSSAREWLLRSGEYEIALSGKLLPAYIRRRSAAGVEEAAYSQWLPVRPDAPAAMYPRHVSILLGERRLEFLLDAVGQAAPP